MFAMLKEICFSILLLIWLIEMELYWMGWNESHLEEGKRIM